MPTLRFTARTIAALKLPASGQVDYWDTTLPGFGLRASPTRKVWTVYYRHRGRKRRLTLGKYPDLPLADARELAKTHLHQIALGADPSAAKQEERGTFKDTLQALFDEYAKKAHRKRSWKEERRILEKEVLPILGQTLVRDLTRRDIRRLIEAKAETAPIMANRLLARLSRLLNFAVEREWIDANPAHKLPKPSEEGSRNRVLSVTEIGELWDALGETVARDPDGTPRLGEDGQPLPRLTATLNDAFRVLLLTGQRLGEVTRMRWADVDLEKGWWTISGRDTKNRDEHRVPLTADVLDILKARRRAADERLAAQKPAKHKKSVPPVYVFGNGPGTRSVAARARKAASHLSRGLSFAFRAHDLRRTAASGMAEAGVSREHIAHVLNHRSVTHASVTAIYDRYQYDREKQRALETWARVVNGIIEGHQDGARVVPFAR